MTDAYDVTLDRTPRRVVVKLYRDGDGTAPLEWSGLGFAQRVALRVPEPIIPLRLFRLPTVSLATAVSVGLVAGLFPALRAARLAPVEALRYA